MTTVFHALLLIIPLALACGLLLGWASVRLQVRRDPVVEQVNRLLPQTQCGQCGHPGCRPYAEAIATGAAINRCPPGGQATVDALAALLNRASLPVDTERGESKPPQVVRIREQECIGCTKCIQACPVDAIIGAHRLMHTVVADYCTGCELCIEPCPVDCIDIVPLKVATPPPQRHSGLLATDRRGELA